MVGLESGQLKSDRVEYNHQQPSEDSREIGEVILPPIQPLYSEGEGKVQ